MIPNYLESFIVLLNFLKIRDFDARVFQKSENLD